MPTSGDLTDFTKWPGSPHPHPRQGYTSTTVTQVFRILTAGEHRMLIGVQRADKTGAAVLCRSGPGLLGAGGEAGGFPGQRRRPDAFGYMWECPGLVRLKDEDTGEDGTSSSGARRASNPTRRALRTSSPASTRRDTW